MHEKIKRGRWRDFNPFIPDLTRLQNIAASDLGYGFGLQRGTRPQVDLVGQDPHGRYGLGISPSDRQDRGHQKDC